MPSGTAIYVSHMLAIIHLSFDNFDNIFKLENYSKVYIWFKCNLSAYLGNLF